MTAQEIITLAQAGELQNLGPSIRNDTAVIAGFINLGLVEIYKRFTLRTDEALITLVDGKTIYTLDGTDPDVTMGSNPYFYIIAAYGEVSTDDYSTNDVLLPLNEEDNLYSINTVSYYEVQIPLITAGSVISLIYASRPTKVDPLNLSAEVDIPEQFIEPLLHYIGYRAHGSMDGNIQTESNTHYMRFEASCERVRLLGVGITSDDLEMSDRIYNRGFA